MRFPITATCLSALLVAGAVPAGDYRSFPGEPIDGSTLRFKSKVEEIYSSGHHERALFIYANELAPGGDKYAQYMVGYMHLTGRGVDRDPAAALAWYRLAAERGEPKFIEAREALEESLVPAELERSAALFAELWQRFGDKRLILDLIREDLMILTARGGASAIPVARVGAGYSDSPAGDPHYRRVRAQLAERLRYLNAMPAPPVEESRVAALEASVRRELQEHGLLDP